MKWSVHDNFIVENLGKVKQVDMARILGNTPENLSHRLRRMGLAKKRQKITPLEYEQYFRDNASAMTQTAMAAELGVSLSTIARCLRTLGISTAK